jgi:hypothetical protein
MRPTTIQELDWLHDSDVLSISYDTAGETDWPILWLKAESLQPIGAFKIRGAANKILQLELPSRSRAE